MHVNELVAVVTGGAQGIGRRTAEVLAERGYALAIIDLQSPALRVGTTSGPAEVLEYAGDITREETVADFAAQVFARFGRVDALVNNAASA